MNGLITLIDSLAWPSAVLAIALLFRREVRGVLTRLGQFKYAGVEMTFRDNLRDAEVLSRAIPRADNPEPAHSTKIHLEVSAGDGAELVGTMVDPATPISTTVLVAAPSQGEPRPTRSTGTLLQTCVHSPREGVRDTWEELRLALIQAAAALGDRRALAPVGVEGAVRFLVNRGWINSVEGQLVDRLRLLAERAEACDGPPLASDEARRFVDLAAPLIKRIVGLGITT